MNHKMKDTTCVCGHSYLLVCIAARTFIASYIYLYCADATVCKTNILKKGTIRISHLLHIHNYEYSRYLSYVESSTGGTFLLYGELMIDVRRSLCHMNCEIMDCEQTHTRQTLGTCWVVILIM